MQSFIGLPSVVPEIFFFGGGGGAKDLLDRIGLNSRFFTRLVVKQCLKAYVLQSQASLCDFWGYITKNIQCRKKVNNMIRCIKFVHIFGNDCRTAIFAEVKFGKYACSYLGFFKLSKTCPELSGASLVNFDTYRKLSYVILIFAACRCFKMSSLDCCC